MPARAADNGVWIAVSSLNSPAGVWDSSGACAGEEESNPTRYVVSSIREFEKDDEWQMIEAWVYPEVIIERFDGMSNSGGSWGPDGRLYLTGHDRSELYVVDFPDAGSVLKLIEIVPIGNRGQGFAWDRTDPGVIYTIRKKEREVVVFKMKKSEK